VSQLFVTDSTPTVNVARLIRPQGRHGEILCEILTDFPERFAQMRDTFLSRGEHGIPTPITIEHSWLHKGRVVLKFAGIDSISAAETLRGTEVVIPAEERMPLDEDTAYIGDLIGCQLIDLSQPGQPAVGTVRDVIHQEQTADLLVVLGGDGTEHWIPFAQAYLVRVDLPGHTLKMNLPAGLLEVNAPLSEEERRIQQEESQLSGQPSGDEPRE
jgi:16S rRNA processing protein RimM